MNLILKIIFFIIVIIFMTDSSRIERDPEKVTNIIDAHVQKIEAAADAITKKMSLEDKIGQLLLMAIPGVSLNQMNKNMLQTYKPGGIILFGFNIQNSNQLKNYLSKLQEYNSSLGNPPLIVSIDQEGGRVRRIQDGITQFPGAMAVGSADDIELTEKYAKVLAMQLRSIGVNMNYMPILDVNTNPKNPIINMRAFGTYPEHVAKIGTAYTRGLQAGKCIAVGKHFPGHGSTDTDSHKTLPVINFNIEYLKMNDLLPFKKASDENIEAIMTAHIAYPEILKTNLPATLSKFFITDILKNDIGFKGIIISDDLAMHAVAATISIEKSSVLAIQSGVNMLLITSYGSEVGRIKNSVKNAVLKGDIDISLIDYSVKKILITKMKYNIARYNDETSLVEDYPNYQPEDFALLQSAHDVNRDISDKGLYLYNKNNRKFACTADEKCFLMTGNPLLADKAALYNNFTVIPRQNINSLYSKLKSEEKNIKVYYDISSKNDENILSFTKNNITGVDLFLICYNNPFLIAPMENLPSTLFVFSTTDQSMISVMRAINGDIIPKENLPMKIGIKLE